MPLPPEISNSAAADPAIARTRAWVSTFIAAHTICPFAQRELERDSVRYVTVDASGGRVGVERALIALIEECRLLDENEAIETTLIIVTAGLDDFETYLSALDTGERLMEAEGYEGIYQLASFHPDYCFADAEPDDVANYTNRSPHPMLHILREDRLEAALENFPHPERIPERNIRHTRAMGEAQLKALLASCG